MILKPQGTKFKLKKDNGGIMENLDISNFFTKASDFTIQSFILSGCKGTIIQHFTQCNIT